ncbi:MAG: D-glycero-beta-D-manno-heptose-7-phosphate kinase [Bacteroidetes bacterium]|nr:D-glycero-beta-D-manno-heptose-7-phosphate kinase [Bacteroidota bacterium]
MNNRVRKIAVSNLFKQFAGMEALVIGDVMVDSYIWGKVERISPEAPVPVVSVKSRQERLGGAANVGLNLLALGANPFLVSVIGNDAHGKIFHSLLKKRNLSHDGIISHADRITTAKFRIMSGNYQMLRVDDETDSVISASMTSNLLKKIKSLIAKSNFKVIIFQDYDKGVIHPDLISEVTLLAQKAGIPIAVDPKKRNFLAYHDVELFKPNLKELQEGLKLETKPGNIEELDHASLRLAEIIGNTNTLITMSDKGVYISSHSWPASLDSSAIFPAHIRNIADVSGAGDTVISVAALGMACGMKPYDYAEFSNLAGGLVCEHVGVVPVDPEVLMKEAKLRLPDTFR